MYGWNNFDRCIIHCDINGHFANSELLYYPELQPKPFVVGGSDGSRNGIILSKNQAAKKYRLQTGNSLIQARQICPVLVSHPPNYNLFRYTSDKFFAFMDHFTDIVAGFGCDGVSLDVTGSMHLFGDIFAVVREIHERFPKEYGLYLSIGVSWNFVLAKLACDTAGPNGVRWITRESKDDTAWQKDVYAMPVEELLYVGGATKEKLWARGIRSIGDMVSCGPEVLKSWFGVKGLEMYVFATGQYNLPIVAPEGGPPMRSIGNGSTTPYDMMKDDQAHCMGHVLVSSICERMRAHKVMPKTVEVAVTYTMDGNMRYQTFQGPMRVPSNIDTEFAETALDLLERNFHFKYPIRKLTLRGKDLMFNTDVYQTELEINAERRENKMKLLACKDELNERWKHSVRRLVELADPQLTGLGSKANQQFAPAGWY